MSSSQDIAQRLLNELNAAEKGVCIKGIDIDVDTKPAALTKKQTRALKHANKQKQQDANDKDLLRSLGTRAHATATLPADAELQLQLAGTVASTHATSLNYLNNPQYRQYVQLIARADSMRRSPAPRVLLLQEAVPLAEQLGDLTLLNNLLLDMGEMYNEVCEFRAAQDAAHRVMSTEHATQLSPLQLLRANTVLGRAHESLVQPDKARPYLETALAIAREIKDEAREAAVLGHIGIVQELLGDYDAAFRTYDDTLRRALQLGDK
eukprot:PhM_4_TR18827/c3_g1_i3/m.95730